MRKLCFIIVLFVVGLYQVYATNYFVSSTNVLSSTNLQSIAHLNKMKLTNKDSVFFKRGETFRGQIKGLPKFFGAYGSGAKPIIMGSELLTGWTVVSGKGNNTIWKTHFDSEVHQLFVDTVRQIIARWPNGEKGFVLASTGSSDSVVAAGIPSGVVGARIRARVTDWTWRTAKVTAQKGNTLLLDGLQQFSADHGFCLDGVLPLLDADNEWVAIKSATSGFDIYFNPAGTVNPNTLKIEGSVHASGFGNGDDENKPDDMLFFGLSNLQLDNLDIRNQVRYAVCGMGANGGSNKINNCDFRGQDISSILLFGTNHQINNCNFKDILGNAIYLYKTTNVSIKGNSFQHIGRVPGMGREGDMTMIAIVSDNGVGNYFGYNRFDSIGSGGIYSSGQNALIEKNRLYYTNLFTNDQGSIYTIGTYTSNAGTVIRNNYIYKTSGSPLGLRNGVHAAHSIYFDGTSRYVTALNNTIISPGGTGILNNGMNHFNTISNNVIYGAANGLITIAVNEPVEGLRVLNNEFYAKGPSQTVVKFVSPSGDLTPPATLSNNYYVQPYVADANANIHIRSNSFAVENNISNSEWNKLLADNGKGSFYYGVTAATDKAVLFSNLTDTEKVYNLSCPYKDLDNKDITTFVLQPYTSRILININSCSELK